MRRGFRLFGVFMTLVVLALVGGIAYNVGWTDGVNTHVSAGATAAPYYYSFGSQLLGAGLGIFGLLWFFFAVFVLFALLRLAFFGRRMMRGGMGGPWAHGKGFYGRGQGMPGRIEERMQEWHRRAHGEQPSASTATAPPPPGDQQTV
jgi:hypothetical protein